MKKIAGKFLGYNKQLVDDYLEKTQAAREAEISLLTENIEACKQEGDQLQKELQTLLEERDRYVAMMDLIEFATGRLQSSIQLFHDASDKDVERLTAEVDERIELYRLYARNIEREIRQIREDVDKMLYGIMQHSSGASDQTMEESNDEKVVGTILSPASKAEIVAAMGEDIIGKNVVFSNGATAGQVDRLASGFMDSEIKGFYLKGDKYVPADLVLAVKKDSLVISVDWQKANAQWLDSSSIEELEQLKMNFKQRYTADGLSQPISKHNGSVESNLQQNDSEQNQSINEDVAKNQSMAFMNPVTDGGFWDCIPDKTLSFSEPSEKEITSDNREAMQDAVNELSTSLSEVAVTTSVPVLEQDISSDDENKDDLKMMKLTHEQNQQDNVEFVRSSPAINKEIKVIRHKYVVGKLAGQDLMDSQGKIIIHKNEEITSSVIEKAEKEGKMAELIVHMVIPGLEH